MGQFGPHLHCSAFGGAVVLGVGCSWAWGSIFMGGFQIVAVTVLLVGGIGQSFLNSKRSSPKSFLLWAMGCQQKLGCFQVVGGCSLKYLPVKAFDLLDLLEH